MSRNCYVNVLVCVYDAHVGMNVHCNQNHTICQSLQVKSFVLFVTHYPLLAELEPKYPGMVANFHMAYVEVEESSESCLAEFSLHWSVLVISRPALQ